MDPFCRLQRDVFELHKGCQMIFIIKFKGGERYLEPCKGSTQTNCFLGLRPKLPKICVIGPKKRKVTKKGLNVPKGAGTDLRLGPKN